MQQVDVQLTRKVADGYIIPLGPANLVAIMTDVGMVGCGAFDVAALDSFSYPAAKVRPSIGPSIVDTDDLLKGIVKEANRSAMGRGNQERHDRACCAGTALICYRYGSETKTFFRFCRFFSSISHKFIQRMSAAGVSARYR
ncbi:MAG: YunC family protein [Desulfobacterales bacterium]|nr:YunC family protein [Desulfobacterales bacterium]